MADVTFQGEPMTLVGALPGVGDDAPTFQLSASPVDAITFDKAPERPLLLTTAPSVDTPVCASQLKNFDGRIGDGDFDLWFVTRDTPFALDRFCGEHDISTAHTLSDFKYRALGEAFGLEIGEMGLLARSVFVIDTDGTVAYRELVTEIADEPDYDAALKAVSELST